MPRRAGLDEQHARPQRARVQLEVRAGCVPCRSLDGAQMVVGVRKLATPEFNDRLGPSEVRQAEAKLILIRVAECVVCHQRSFVVQPAQSENISADIAIRCPREWTRRVGVDVSQSTYIVVRPLQAPESEHKELCRPQSQFAVQVSRVELMQLLGEG